ncbi:hypothetical protein [Micromonospora sp. NPDC005197]|uniref:hypothetical protein n=1 Tax=Micromonospora sp. NPDC005197 TaxID=3157020 RepID=UPI00339F093A
MIDTATPTSRSSVSGPPDGSPAKRVTFVNLATLAMLPAMPKETERDNLRVEQAVVRAQQAELRADQAELRAKEAAFELEKLRNSDLRRKEYEKFQLWSHGIQGGTWAVIVGATYFPLRAVEQMLTHFEKDAPELTHALQISISFSVVLLVFLGITGAQSRLRKRKIKGQRERLKELEQELKGYTQEQGGISS